MSAQNFHFGVSAGLIASQVDGDELIGFNKFGFHGGIMSGYSINDENWLLVELEYSELGSKKGNEQTTVSLALGIRSINVGLAYCYRFGDNWDAEKKFRAFGGFKAQRVLDVESVSAPEEAFKSLFFSLNLGMSYLITPKLMIDLSYTHSLTNILKESVQEIDSLHPYYLSLGLSYYLSKNI